MSQLKLSTLCNRKVVSNKQEVLQTRRNVSCETKASNELTRLPFRRRELSFVGLLAFVSFPVKAGDLRRDLKAELDTQITHKVRFQDSPVMRDV